MTKKNDYITITEEYFGLTASARIPIRLVQLANFDLIEAEREKLKTKLASAWYHKGDR